VKPGSFPPHWCFSTTPGAVECNQDSALRAGPKRAGPEGDYIMSKSAIVPLALLACALSATPADQAAPKDAEQKSSEDSPKGETGTRRPRIRFGGFMFGAGYTHWSRGWCCGYGYGYYGLWAPFYPGVFAWDPFLYSPYYNSGFAWGPNMGEVKLHASLKNAEVFLDGAYAGSVSERKSMWLDPGAYNIEVRAPGRPAYVKRIYVLSGKSLRLNAKMEP